MKSDEIYYQAILTRDYRFDGKFFVGAKTTKIYCRPICPAKPKRENVEFFPDAASAEKAGYRPCLRCHPESAPLSPNWLGKSAVVQRALKMIAVNQLTELNEDQFAEELGVTARHLRRIFKDELGLTPKKVSDNNRLNFAWKLLTETNLSVTTVAFTAGFTSLRRFNDAIKKRFKHSPSEIRHKKSHTDKNGIELSLAYRPPLDWPAMLLYFQNHCIPYVDRVTENSYERVFKIGETSGVLQIQPDPVKPQLKLCIITDHPKHLFEIVLRVRKMFDLDSDPLLIANQFAASPLLSQLWEKHPGLRLARGWDPFETAICTTLGQLVSTEHAARLVEQLVLHYGEIVLHPLTDEEWRLFPTPEILATASLDEVKTTKIRKAAIRELSRKVTTSEILLSEFQDPKQFKKSLLQISGIGPWSAEYISLRGLGDTDAFPFSDLILKRALELHQNLDIDLVKPWRAYAAVYLWKEYAQKLSNKKKSK